MFYPASLKRAIALLLGTALSSSAWALPDIPVYLKESVSPNILLTLDDSGSMAWGYMPDSLSSLTGTTRFLANSFNPIQYDPRVTTKYPLPPKADGTLYDTAFTAAWLDGFLRVNNTPLDLSTSYRPTSSYTPGNTTQSTIGTAQAAYYYVYDTTLGTCAPVGTGNDGCYRKVVVSATSGPGATDERQRFANWYSFYRTRNLLLRSSLLVALADADANIRFAWQSLNTCQGGWGGSSCTNVLGTSYANGMAAFNATQKQRLYGWAAGLPASGGTPLRNAFVRAGNYFRSTDTNSPYRDTPGSASTAANACRLSYHVALTDGVWNGTLDQTPAPGNSDSTAGALPDGIAYASRAPFAGTDSDSIADIAFSLWRADLQSGMANTSPAYSITGNTSAPNTWPASEYWDPRNDPATWQHLVTYTIGLGLGNVLTSPQWKGSTFASDSSGNGYQQFATGTAWPATGDNAIPGNVYDLWHAAINGRGEFFSADNPKQVYDAFQSVLARISARSGTVGNVATSAAYILTDSLAYQASFSTLTWSGTVSAQGLNRDGSIGAEVWNTNTTLAATINYTTRNLYTRQLKTTANPNPAVIPFSWASMNADTKLALQTEDTVKWLAGDQTHEQNDITCTTGCIFRQRARLLGDVLGSGVTVAADQDFGYKTATWAGGGSSYRTYLTAKTARTPAVLVGANDGFVHVLHAKNGTELFGFAPGAVVDKLWRLAEPIYVKKAFVDGPITIGDAYIGSAWATYAVGTLGAGGKSVYALDVTDPSAMSASSVKWEFTHASLGYVLSKPIIARLPNGVWVAVFSGGYESGDNSTSLFIVNLQTGALIANLPATKSTDACGATPVAGTAKGLGAPRAFTTLDGDFFVYAGDLWGHLWRFEYQSSSGGQLATSYSGSPMFKACNGSSQAQAITAAPSVISLGASPFVYFGTGRLFDSGDTSLTTGNSFYAMLDDNVAQSLSRTALLGQQTISSLSATARGITSNAVNLVQKRGWFVDLPTTGERIVSSPVFIDERVAFNTLIPATAACESKGTSWLFEVSTLSGASAPEPVLDLNSDGKFTNADKILVGGTYVVPAAKAIEATVSGITTVKSSDRPDKGAGAAGQCSGGKVNLITSNVYTPGYTTTCTPGATFRSGWRQMR